MVTCLLWGLSLFQLNDINWDNIDLSSSLFKTINFQQVLGKKADQKVQDTIPQEGIKTTVHFNSGLVNTAALSHWEQ